MMINFDTYVIYILFYAEAMADFYRPTFSYTSVESDAPPTLDPEPFLLALIL